MTKFMVGISSSWSFISKKCISFIELNRKKCLFFRVHKVKVYGMGETQIRVCRKRDIHWKSVRKKRNNEEDNFYCMTMLWNENHLIYKAKINARILFSVECCFELWFNSECKYTVKRNCNKLQIDQGNLDAYDSMKFNIKFNKSV